MRKLFLLMTCILTSAHVVGQGYCDELQFCSHSSSDMTIQQVKSFFSDNITKLSTDSGRRKYNISSYEESKTLALVSKKNHRKHIPVPNEARPVRGAISENSILNIPSQNHILENVNTAQKIVNRILCLANNPDIEIKVNTNKRCQNATAVHCIEGDYVFYSTDYLEKIMNSGDSNIIYGIFAHEVGHLIRGDAWIGSEKRHEAELNADKFAGHIMGLMNFTQKTAIASLNGVSVNVTKTHPAKIKREAILIEGWIEGQANRRKINSASLAYLMECKPDDDSPFRIYYQMQGKSEQKTDFYNIACQIGGNPEKLRTIKNVIYYLHPSSFEKNSVKYKGNQILSLEIWGSFELRASVVCEEDGIVNEYLLQENLVIIDGKIKLIDKAYVPDVYIDNINSTDRKEAKIPLVSLMKGVNFSTK